MKKRAHTLKLNRETVLSLAAAETLRVRGGLLRAEEWKCSGCDSGCGIFD